MLFKIKYAHLHLKVTLRVLLSMHCITELEGFDAVCLNPWVLQAGFYSYIGNIMEVGIFETYLKMSE